RLIAKRTEHRGVGRSIRRDHDLELATRVVEVEQILDASLDAAGFVVRHQDDRDRRLDGRATDGSEPQRGPQPREAGIAHVDVHQEKHRRPQNGRHDQRLSNGCRASMSTPGFRRSVPARAYGLVGARRTFPARALTKPTRSTFAGKKLSGGYA